MVPYVRWSVRVAKQVHREKFNIVRLACWFGCRESTRVRINLQQFQQGAPKRLGQLLQWNDAGCSVALFPRAVSTLFYGHPGGHVNLIEAMGFAKRIEQGMRIIQLPMQKILKPFHLAAFLVATLLVAFCTKSNLADSPTALPSPEENVTSRAEEFCAGTTSIINLNIPIVDGMLSFSDHAAMISALNLLFSYDVDDVAAWENQKGFKSLFSEHARIEELPVENMTTELTTGRLAKIMNITPDETLNMPLYNMYLSRILNTDGLVRVGNYIGTIGRKVSIWTSPSNKVALIQALDSRVLPTGTDFVVLDNRFFGVVGGVEDRGDTELYSSDCPVDASLSKSIDNLQVSTGDNRRIDVDFDFITETSTPLSNGNRDYTCTFVITTTSKKSKKNTYKTDHYWSYNFRTTTFTPGASVLNWSGTGQNSCTKMGGKTVSIVSYFNVTTSFLTANGIRLLEVIPGSNGQNGTAASHRGMNGEYVRWTCN